MRRRRPLALVLAVVVAAAIVVGVGRWQARRDTVSEQRGIERIWAVVSKHPALDGWRITSTLGFRCLSYRQGAYPFAYELCFDSAGRLVEALDRTGPSLAVSTVRSQPQDATIRVSSPAIDTVLRQMGAFSVHPAREVAHQYLVGTRTPHVRVPQGSGLPSARP